MTSTFSFGSILSWIFGLIVLTLGILNMILIHPVPGIVYLILSLIYFPPIEDFLNKKMGFRIPIAVKIILGIIIVWFTLGISDLAEMYGF